MCWNLVKEIDSLGERLTLIASAFDSLGPESAHATGSKAKRFAELRDHADLCLSRAVSDLSVKMRSRANYTHSVDLLADSVLIAMGNCNDCIDLIESFYRLLGDDTEGTGQVDAETFPDQFLWDLAQRVESFPAFAERYPKHLYFAARHLHGLPMMVSHHIDITHDFKRLADMLRMGTKHPLDVSARSKKGGRTPIMAYMEPIIYRLNTLREILQSRVEQEPESISYERINWLWTYSYSEKTPEAVIEVLRKLTLLPSLTKSVALLWSREVVVPYVLLTDGMDAANSDIPFIRNIWAHRSVKSTATFRSRLQSAVTGFLERYSRSQ